MRLTGDFSVAMMRLARVLSFLLRTMPIRVNKKITGNSTQSLAPNSTSFMRQSEIIPRNGAVQIETAIAAPQ